MLEYVEQITRDCDADHAGVPRPAARRRVRRPRHPADHADRLVVQLHQPRGRCAGRRPRLTVHPLPEFGLEAPSVRFPAQGNRVGSDHPVDELDRGRLLHRNRWTILPPLSINLGSHTCRTTYDALTDSRGRAPAEARTVNVNLGLQLPRISRELAGRHEQPALPANGGTTLDAGSKDPASSGGPEEEPYTPASDSGCDNWDSDAGSTERAAMRGGNSEKLLEGGTARSLLSARIPGSVSDRTSTRRRRRSPPPHRPTSACLPA